MSKIYGYAILVNGTLYGLKPEKRAKEYCTWLQQDSADKVEAVPLVAQVDVDALRLLAPQCAHAQEWLDAGGCGTGRADDAIVKITDAKGQVICSANAEWLRAVTSAPRFGDEPRQEGSFSPDATGG